MSYKKILLDFFVTHKAELILDIWPLISRAKCQGFNSPISFMKIKRFS